MAGSGQLFSGIHLFSKLACCMSGRPVELLAMLEINIFFQAVAKLLEVTPKDDQVENIVQFHRNLTILVDAK